jgi:hypothetical protein
MSHAAHIKLSAAEHVKPHHFSLLPSNFLLLHLLLATPFLLPKQWLVRLTKFLPSLSSPPSTTTRVILGRRVIIRWRFLPPQCSCCKYGVNVTIPNMSDYWNKSMITESDHQAYHSFGWLTGGLESIVPTVECPTVDGTTVVCFKGHLIAGLGLPPSKFLVVVLDFLGCELVLLNPNAIAALSCFTMLYEFWLGIALDTSLF